MISRYSSMTMLPPATLKYVDDVNTAEQHNTRKAMSLFSQNKEKQLVHAKECENQFNVITANAQRIGMRVNPMKTKLLCLSSAIHSEVSSYIVDGAGNKISSQDSLVVLGFAFNSRPTVTAHMEMILKKFNARMWVLRHLKQSAVPTKDIVAVYSSTVRSSIEYASHVIGKSGGGVGTDAKALLKNYIPMASKSLMKMLL